MTSRLSSTRNPSRSNRTCTRAEERLGTLLLLLLLDEAVAAGGALTEEEVDGRLSEGHL